jgi:hypothetical protein
VTIEGRKKKKTTFEEGQQQQPKKWSPRENDEGERKSNITNKYPPTFHLLSIRESFMFVPYNINPN